MIRTFLAAGAAAFTLAAAAAGGYSAVNPPPEPIAPVGHDDRAGRGPLHPAGGPEIDSGRFAARPFANGDGSASGL